MSKKLITAIKQLNKVQYLPKGSEIKVPLLKDQIDIESLKDKDNDELKDVFFKAVDSIPEAFKEFIPKKLSILHAVIYEKRSLGELSRGGAGTGFVPDQDKNCPVCGKNLDISKKKPPFDDYFCQHVLLMTRPLFESHKFSYVNKTMSEVADELIKKDSGEHYKGLDKQIIKYAEYSDCKYEVIEIINYNSRHQETCYYLIDMMGKQILDWASSLMPEDMDGWGFDPQEEYWNKVIHRKRFDMDFAYHNRGKLYSSIGRQQLAIDDYSQAIRVKPNADIYNDRGLSYSEISQFQLARGLSCSEISEFQLAIEDYNEAIRLKPDFSEAYTNRGDTYYKLGQYESAIKDYDEAIRLKPDNDSAYNNRGLAYKKVGQYDRAIEDYNEAIRLKPNNASYHKAYYFNKACCLAIQKKVEESCNALKYAIKGGYNCDNFNKDKEFDNIISEPCFIALIEEFPGQFDKKEIKEILKNAKKKIKKEKK